MPFGVGAPELLIILVIVVVIFGAGKLPEIGTALGRSIRGFKEEVTDAQAEEEAAKAEAAKAGTTLKSEARPTVIKETVVQPSATVQAPPAAKDEVVR